MIRFSHNHKNDYDKQIEFHSQKIGCYSQDALDRLYPNGNYKILGEIRLSNENKKDEKRKQEKRKAIGEVHIWESLFHVLPHTRFHLLYKAQGYICVGDDSYLLIRQSRVPFLIPFGFMTAGIIACIVLILLMLGKKGPLDSIGTNHPLPPVDSNVETLEETEEGGESATDTEPGGTTGEDPSSGTEPAETDPVEIDPIETDPSETEKDPTETEKDPAETDPAEGGGSVSMIYTRTVSYTYGESRAYMYFKNPSKSDHDVVLELYALGTDGERVLMAKSGRIPAGTGLETMTLEKNIPDLSPNSYRGLYRVLFYDPVTGERAMISSEIADLIISVGEN